MPFLGHPTAAAVREVCCASSRQHSEPILFLGRGSISGSNAGTTCVGVPRRNGWAKFVQGPKGTVVKALGGHQREGEGRSLAEGWIEEDKNTYEMKIINTAAHCNRSEIPAEIRQPPGGHPSSQFHRPTVRVADLVFRHFLASV